ncbi:MAG: ABC transporter permease [Candidatus Aminicenantes bacterium]|nr:ABC transporter permease [Candidatus Aminicenantes bacterium]
MKNLSILWNETKLMLVMFFRDRQSIFWAYIFPAGLLILFTVLWGSKSNPAIASGMLVGVIGISVMSGGLFGIGVGVVSAREAGIYKRYKTTPLSSWIIFAAHILTRALALFSTILVLVLISVIGFQVKLEMNIFASIVIVLLGIFTFCALGFVIASFAKSIGAALGITNILLMFMMFIGGLLPLNMLPKLLQTIARLLPITYFRIALQLAMFERYSLLDCWKSVGILLGFLLVFSAISIKWFHWERTS